MAYAIRKYGSFVEGMRNRKHPAFKVGGIEKFVRRLEGTLGLTVAATRARSAESAWSSGASDGMEMRPTEREFPAHPHRSRTWTTSNPLQQQGLTSLQLMQAQLAEERRLRQESDRQRELAESRLVEEKRQRAESKAKRSGDYLFPVGSG